MNLRSLLAAPILCGLFGANLTAQADEHAIRTTSSISTINFYNGQWFFYTITIRSWNDLICFPGEPVRTAAQVASSAYQIVTHSNGNISLRFGRIGNPAWNNGIVELWHNGAKVDGDRLRML